MERLPVAALDAEMVAWIDGVLAKPLDFAALEVATWEREHEMQVPRLDEPGWTDPDYDRKYEQWDTWERVQSLKHNAIDKAHQKQLRIAREMRKKEDEIRKAEELDLTLRQYRDARSARAIASWRERMRLRDNKDNTSAGLN